MMNIQSGGYVLRFENGGVEVLRDGQVLYFNRRPLYALIKTVLSITEFYDAPYETVEKDDTDTMLAVKIAKEKGARHITVIGGAGGRADHWLSNIFMLEALAEEGLDTVLVDGINEIRAVCDGTVRVPNNGGYFGILALSDCIITSTGCKYPLTEAPLLRAHPYGVSNEVTGDFAEITVKGHAVITVSKR